MPAGASVPSPPPTYRVLPVLWVGTGGAATLDYLKRRGDKGYWFAGYSPIMAEIDETAPDRGPRECLERIRAILKPTITELAEAVGVSRQAVYDWLSGKVVSKANAARLAVLARGADRVAAESVPGTTWMVRRPLKDGKSFFVLLKEGVDAEYALRLLIELIHTESRERDVLDRRLARRGRPTRESFEQIGIPMLDERG